MKISPGAQIFDAFSSFYKLPKSCATLGCWVTAIVVSAWVWPVRAAVDLSVGSTLRSYPLSGVAEAEVGYSRLLWGDPKSPLYGYVRPRIYGSSALTYNSLDGALEVFPLSFLGARAGAEGIQNDRRYSPFNCDDFRCRGRFYHAYFETEVSAGYGPVFAQFRWRREHWTEPTHQDGDFVEPTSGLLMRASGEEQTIYYGVAGYKVDANWAGLLAVRYAKSDTHDVSRLPFAGVRYRTGSLSVTAGAGEFESTLKKSELTLVAIVRWEIWPSLALH